MSSFSRNIGKTSPKMVVRVIRDIKELDSIEEKKSILIKKFYNFLTRAGSAPG